MEQLVCDMETSPLKISLQLDETTDVVNCCPLITLAMYVHDSPLTRTFFSVKNWQTATKARNVFQFAKEFFAKRELNI